MKQTYLLKGQPEEWTWYHQQQGIFQYNYYILIRKGGGSFGYLNNKTKERKNL